MDQRYTRRDVARLLGAGALGLALSSALRAGDAGAAIRWCRTDPVVKIDGRTADILLGSYDTLHETATGPAEIVITIPNTSTGELLATDRGWGGHGYQVSFVRSDKLRATGSDTPVRIETYVPSRDGALPLVVDFLPRSSGLAKASVEGTVNAWVLLRTQ